MTEAKLMNDEQIAELTNLAEQLWDAKRAEDEAKTKRIEAEEKIAALIQTEESASKTIPIGGGLKITVKRGLNYKADMDALRNMALMAEDAEAELPVKLTDPIPAGYIFDEDAYEALKESHPDFFAEIAQHVTVTPKKVSVTLKLQ
jgi:hypothetical protein